jgi:hypothetical protein
MFFKSWQLTATYNYQRTFLFLNQINIFVMFSALCRIFVIDRIFGIIFLSNIRFGRKQENPFPNFHKLLFVVSCFFYHFSFQYHPSSLLSAATLTKQTWQTNPLDKPQKSVLHLFVHKARYMSCFRSIANVQVQSSLSGKFDP